jgi:hypothetical protein
VTLVLAFIHSLQSSHFSLQRTDLSFVRQPLLRYGGPEGKTFSARPRELPAFGLVRQFLELELPAQLSKFPSIAVFVPLIARTRTRNESAETLDVTRYGCVCLDKVAICNERSDWDVGCSLFEHQTVHPKGSSYHILSRAQRHRLISR